jgi:hypothetical protein
VEVEIKVGRVWRHAQRFTPFSVAILRFQNLRELQEHVDLAQLRPAPGNRQQM